MPVPETNGEEWDRLEPIVALDALVELVVVGEYAGLSEGDSKQRVKDALLLRTAGASVFEVIYPIIRLLLYSLQIYL